MWMDELEDGYEPCEDELRSESNSLCDNGKADGADGGTEDNQS